MWELLEKIFMDLLLIGVIFIIYVAIRNRWFKTKEHGIFKKDDQFVILLITYMIFIFGTIEINCVDRVITITENYRQNEFVWIPFKYLSYYQDYLKFLIYTNQSSNYYSLLTLSDYLIYYCRVLLIGLPIAFSLYIVSKKKWVGFITNILVLILCFKLAHLYNIGDGLLMGVFSYLIVAVICILLKSIKINNYWVKYALFGILVTLTLIFVVNFQFSFASNDKLIKAIPFEKQIKTYDNMITVNFEDVSLYESGIYNECLSFHGYLDFDEKLFEGIPFSLKNNSDNNFSVVHKYSLNGKKHGLGTGNNNFLMDKDSLFDNDLRFYDYPDYNKKENKQFTIDNDNESSYFEYYGISKLSFGLYNYIELSGFEILEEGFKKDNYLYYEVVYKTNKFKDLNIEWDVFANSFDNDHNDIDHEYTKPEIIEETDEYIITKEKFYYYKTDRDDINNVEVKVYNGHWYLDEKDTELLFTIDRDMFN